MSCSAFCSAAAESSEAAAAHALELRTRAPAIGSAKKRARDFMVQLLRVKRLLALDKLFLFNQFCRPCPVDAARRFELKQGACQALPDNCLSVSRHERRRSGTPFALIIHRARVVLHGSRSTISQLQDFFN